MIVSIIGKPINVPISTNFPKAKVVNAGVVRYSGAVDSYNT